MPPGVALGVEVLRHVPGRAGHGDVRHFVHPVVAHLLIGVVPRRQIVVLAVPHQPAGGDAVALPVPAEHLLFLHIVLKIAEGDDPSGGDGGVDLVHIIKYAFIHGLDPPVHVHLPLELAGLMDAGEPLQLADEAVALPGGEEAAGLHRIHQQLQLRQLEVPLAQKPPRAPALPALDVVAHLTQFLHVGVDALALGGDVPAGQLVDHVLHGDGVLLVGLPLQQPGQHQQLAFLICALGHCPASFHLVSYRCISPIFRTFSSVYHISAAGASGVSRRHF